MNVKPKNPNPNNIKRPPSPLEQAPAKRVALSAQPQSAPRPASQAAGLPPREPWDPELYVALYNAKSNALGLPTFPGDAERLRYLGASLYPGGRNRTIEKFVDAMRDYDLMDM